jgi:hypothetical protein
LPESIPTTVALPGLTRNERPPSLAESLPLPEKAQQLLLQDAAKRDRMTARRVCLLRILWFERYLTRTGLIARVEAELGKECFGAAAWEDTFYRDMRVVKRALRAAGDELAYSRSDHQPGYFLRGKPGLHPDLSRVIDGSVAEVDPAQIAIYRRLTAADRFQQGCSISDTACQAAAYRLCQRKPELSLVEAQRLIRSRGKI